MVALGGLEAFARRDKDRFSSVGGEGLGKGT